jgi:malate permease and related proteins
VLIEVAFLAVFFACGLLVQRRPNSERLRRRIWTVYFWTVAPTLVFFAFSTVTFDRGLALALVAVVLSSWLVLGLGFGYASLVSADREERGALVLGAGFPNTGFVGYPLAQIAFGPAGLALMAVYDRLAMLVPTLAVSTTIARLHGRSPSRRGHVAPLLLNPPLLAAALAVGLRLAGLDAGPVAAPLGHAAAAIIGPAGFFLLGLALPLERPEHGVPELRRAAGALAIRFAAAPLVLAALGQLLGATIPPVFYLAAALPCAFHLLVLARVFELRPQLMRLLVIGSTVPAVVVVAVGSALLH